MGKRKDRKRETTEAKTAARAQVEEALKTIMCTVQTWDRLPRGDEKLRPLEEHPEVYPSIVIREFKKNSRHGQRWFMGMMTCLKDFTPMAEPLLGVALSPEIYSEVKKELAALLTERGHPLDQDTVDAIHKSHDLASSLISELKGEGDAEKIMEKYRQLLSLPQALRKSLIREVVQEAEGRSLPLARAILEEGENSLSAYLIELLRASSSDELHQLLLETAQDKSKRGLHKAAKRALYRLRASGGKFEETEAVKGSILKAPEYKFVGAGAGLIDGEGTRILWLARTKALGGLHFLNFMINDRKGVIDCRVLETNKKNYLEIRSLISPQYEVVDIDHEYCLHLIEEAAKLNAKSDTALPEDYLEAQHIVGKAEKPFDTPLIYTHFQEHEIYPNPLLLEVSADLFEREDFGNWFIAPQDMEHYNFKLQEAQESRIVLSEQSQRERIEDIINSAADELFQGELKKLYRRRLEENAYILYRQGKHDEARLALVAAIALEDENLPPRKHPFLINLVKRSLSLAEEESRDRLITPP